MTRYVYDKDAGKVVEKQEQSNLLVFPLFSYQEPSAAILRALEVMCAEARGLSGIPPDQG